MNHSITIETIKKIAIAIVRAWPYDETYRLNTFAVISNGASDWQSNNFNKSSLDASNFDYYVRDGDYTVDDSRRSGYLAMEHKQSMMMGYTDNRITHEIYFTLALDRICADCIEQVPTRRLFEKSSQMLRQFIREFLNYRVYLVTGASTTAELWASPNSIAAVAESWESGATYAALSPQLGQMITKPLSTEVKLYETELSAYGMIGCSLKMDISSCEPEGAVAFDYDTTDVEQSAVIKCAVCE